MPEEAENYYRIPNPNYSGGDFREEGMRTSTISEDRGIKAIYAVLKRDGKYKIRTFLFDKGKWGNIGACEAWVREHRESFKQIGTPLETVYTCEVSYPERGSGSRPTPDELEIINNYALEALDADQVYVREMRLTNDQWSHSHQIRLSQGFQRSVMGTMPGKALLMGHPEVKGGAVVPEGRFFAADVEHEKPTGVTWGTAKFWVVKSSENDHLRKQIEGGVYSNTSIGMSTDIRECSICGLDILDADCPHIPGEIYDAKEVANADLNPEQVEDEDAKIYCGMVFRGQGTALEGSIVYLSELRGTRIMAEANLAARAGDFGAAKRLMLDSAAGDMPPKADRLDGGGGATQATAPDTDLGTANVSSGVDGAMSEDIKALEAARDAAEQKATGLETQVAELTKTVEEQTAQVGALEKQDAEEKVLRAATVTEVERLAGLLQRESELEAYKAMAGEDLSGMAADKLLALVVDWTQKFDEATPPGGGRQSTDTPRDDGTGEPAEEQHLAEGVTVSDLPYL